MQWEHKLSDWLNEARDEARKHFVLWYWSGYVEALQKILEEGPDVLSAELADAEEKLEHTKENPGVKTSPYEYQRGRLDALRRAKSALTDNS